jgi:hypothetical protein
MFAQLAEATRLLEELLSDLDSSLLSSEQAVAGLDGFAKAEKLCSAGRLLCSGRAVATNAHHGSDARNAADWLARRTGQSLGEAISSLEVARVLPALPALDSALRSGEVSLPQAAAVADGAGADPASESELLSSCARDPLRRLREKARRARAAATREESLVADEEMLRRARFLRTFTGHDGALKGEFSLAPLDGARLLAALEVEERYFFEAARRRGEQEPSSAYAADALLALAERPAGDGRVQPTLVLTVDAAALRRGATEPGETCEIPGVGPVPVATARNLLGESWLRLVVRDGVDVTSVTHLGRYVRSQLQSALEARDPLCVVPGCGQSRLLENDHWRVAFAEGGETCLDNIARICRHHHMLKTHKGHRLVGGPGRWRWLLPGETENDPPPEADPSRSAAGENEPPPPDPGQLVLAGVGAGVGGTLFGDG